MDLDRLGKYRIVGKIGQGAMGVVYKAYDPDLHRFVAIKTLSASLDGEDFRARFRREARWVGQLNHPNIVTIHDFGEEKGHIFMAMELLEGVNLRKLIEVRLPLPLAHRIQILKQIADGLAFAHSRGVVHRDLKPSNVHLQFTGHVKIMDFGLARLASAEPSQPGVVLGTPHYIAPEELKGQRADARSDVFSLGVLFYEFLSYQKPFDADCLSSLLYKVAECDRKPLREVCPELPEPLYLLVEKALERDPELRFSDAGEVRAELARAVDTGEEKLQNPPPVEPHATSGAGALGRLLPAIPAIPRILVPSENRFSGESYGSLTSSRATAPSPRTGRHSRVLAGLVLGVSLATLWLARSEGRAPKGALAADDLERRVASLAEEVREGHLAQAEHDLEKSDYERALAHARRASELDPSSARAKSIENQALAFLEDSKRAPRETESLNPMENPGGAREPAASPAPRREGAGTDAGARPSGEGRAESPDLDDEGSARDDLSGPRRASAVNAEPALSHESALDGVTVSSDLAPPQNPSTAQDVSSPGTPDERLRVPSGSPEAIPITRVPPDYPAVASRSRTEGRVLLEVEVDTSGSPSAVRVLHASPFFEKAAVTAVKRWRWKPYVLEGRPVRFVLTVTVEFRLEG